MPKYFWFMTSVKYALVELSSAFVDQIITPGGIELYLDPNFNPEWNCAVTGKIAAIPISVSKTDAPIIEKLKVGDDVAFSYQVVMDREWGSDAGNFQRMDSTGIEKARWYYNPKGETITIMAYPGAITLKWCGVYNAKNGDMIDSVMGSESDVERWLSQFPLGGLQLSNAKFNNLIEIEGKNFWKVKPQELFAKKDKSGITALNDRLVCKPYEIDVPDQVRIQAGIILPSSSIKARYYDRAIVVAGGGDLGLIAGDVVATEEKFLERYKLWNNKDYFLINKRNILGIWN